jgi:hypothetical protein
MGLSWLSTVKDCLTLNDPASVEPSFSTLVINALHIPLVGDERLGVRKDSVRSWTSRTQQYVSLQLVLSCTTQLLWRS